MRAVAKEFVHRDDVRVRERLRTPRFPLQRDHRVRVILEFVAQDLQRDVGIPVLCLLAEFVTGLEDLPHAAAAELLDQFVSAADDRADAQHDAGFRYADLRDLRAGNRGARNRGIGSGHSASGFQDQCLRHALRFGGRIIAGRGKDAVVCRFHVEKCRGEVIVEDALQRCAHGVRQATFLFRIIEPGRRRHRQFGVAQEKRLEFLRQLLEPDFAGEKSLQQFA